MTLIEGGRRLTHPKNKLLDQRNKLITLGGSFTQGWGVSDHETYPWALQEHFPAMQVLNYGVGGYGTVQSLITLNRVSASVSSSKIVIYGFIPHHEDRNVAPFYWQRRLAEHSMKGSVPVPYGLVDDIGRLVIHRPESYPVWPLRQYLVSVAALEMAYVKFKTYGRLSENRRVTETAMLELDKLSRKYNTRLIIVMLKTGESINNHYFKYLQKHQIEFIDCVPSDDSRLRLDDGDGHPNGQLHALYAQCITSFINKDQ